MKGLLIMKISDEITLTQWKTCVEMADSISKRRDTLNNTFTTLNIAIIAAVSFYWSLKSILILVSGIAICLLWIRLIQNYKALNEEKYTVINDLESTLPNRPFRKEWVNLQRNPHYKDNSKLEKVLPVLFITLYVITLIFLLYFKK